MNQIISSIPEQEEKQLECKKSKKHIGELIKEQQIRNVDKDETHFFEKVLAEIIEKGYLHPEVVQQIQLELIQLWTKQIEVFNRGKSSSITEEKAKALLESIYFTLGFRLWVLEDLDESIALLKDKPIEVLFEEGQTYIKEKLVFLKGQYERLKNKLLPTENMAYRDTYGEGIPPFFKFYSPEFASQECPGSIDYPLSHDKMEENGITYMIGYIEKSLLEHELCWKFRGEEIEVLLQAYHKGYRELLINIYEVVLMHAIGRLMIGKNLETLILEEEDLRSIERTIEILPTHLLEEALLTKGMTLLEDLDLRSPQMQFYVMQTLKKYVPRIELALEEETLDKIFTIANQEDLQSIHYQGGERLSDETFKALTERIRESQVVKDKIFWIKQKVQHVEDLRDILEADCIFDKEYVKLYESLEDIEIALLLNLMRIDENDYSEVETEQDWFKWLNQYLKQLPKAQYEVIKHLVQRIKQ
ncbi:MAG: hypothetical protein E7231_08905 [Cellulosilyticum sp.]|nr:hypothetical protein [Cellulosilyticum sp.]